MRNHLSNLILIAVLINTAPLTAKGLDDIQPRTESEKKEDAKTQGTPTQDGAKTEGAPAEGAGAAASPAASGAIPTEKVSTVANPELVAEKSATSKSLEDRLSLGLSYGIVTVPNAKVGEVNAFGGSDVFLQWRVYKSSEGTRSSRVTLRYLPIDSEATIAGQSYHAIIEAYYGGWTYEWLVSQSLSVFAGIELGYLQVNMESEDRFPVSDASEANEFAYGLTTGLDWLVMQKLKLGPKINVGFGSYQIAQYAGAVSLLF